MSNKRVILGLLTLIFFAILYINKSVIQNYILFLQREYISQNQNHEIIQVSQNLTRSETRTIKMSAESVVRVLSRNSSGIASLSGTVLSYGDQIFVLTASHGINENCKDTVVWTGSDNLQICEELVVIDRELDYAILRISDYGETTPVNLQRVLPSERQRSLVYSLQNKLFYTGFPNGAGPVTVAGRIIGFRAENYFFMHSYAWAGSSGSGVFTYDGKLIGVVIALDIGMTMFGPDVLEDMVIVLPVYKIDWSFLGE